MVSTVLCLNLSRIVFCKSTSVLWSTLAVASSIHKTYKEGNKLFKWCPVVLVCLTTTKKNPPSNKSEYTPTLASVRRARARHSSCLWPTERDFPLSPTAASNPPDKQQGKRRDKIFSVHSFTHINNINMTHAPILRTMSPRWHCSKASSSRCSRWRPQGSRFSLTEWENKKGSWGMMASLDLLRTSHVCDLHRVNLKKKKREKCRLMNFSQILKVSSCRLHCMAHLSWESPTWLTSSPSRSMHPCFSSTIRNSARNRLDFPEPVRPMIPTLSPGFTIKLTPSRALGNPGRYAKTAASNSTRPCAGQEAGS